MRARLSVTITPDDIGSRVTVRARHHGPEASVYDVVGVLTAWSDGQLTIVRRHGEQRHVPERDLLAGKVVPPAPPRRPSRPAKHVQEPRQSLGPESC